MAIDQELAQSILTADDTVRITLKNLQIDGHNLLQKLSNIILYQAQELSLFHLFEAHVDAGKVSEELWTDIATLLKQVRSTHAANSK